VIDYVMINERIGNRISKFKIGDRVDSDHMPMELTMEIRRGRRQGKKIQKQEEQKLKVIEKYIWSQKAIESYAEKTEELGRYEGTPSKELMSVEEK